MNVNALEFFGALISILWIALAVAVGVVVLAAVWLVSRAISRRLEGRYLPEVARWSRRRAGLPEDAGPWACPACSSVNASTVVACYRCGAARPADAPELAEAATDPSVYHRPAPPNEFDPSRYRGPGALPPDPPDMSAPPASSASPAPPALPPTASSASSASPAPPDLPALSGPQPHDAP